MLNDHTINTILGDDNIYLWIDAFLQAKKSENLSKHSIRFYDKSLQVFTIESLRNGVDNITLSRLLGHTNLNMLLRYAKQLSIDLQRGYKSVIDD